ncbi:hypothetical protein PENTCL1PPCAC_3549, partial [Pristionchus entomophagus]
ERVRGPRFARVRQSRVPSQERAVDHRHEIVRDASLTRRRSSARRRVLASPARRCASRGSRQSSCGASSWEDHSCGSEAVPSASSSSAAASAATSVRVGARAATRELEHDALARQLLAVQVVDRVIGVARRDDVPQLAVAAEEVLHVALSRARRQTTDVDAVRH